MSNQHSLEPRGSDAEDVALRFAKHLVDGAFADAYALTSSEFQRESSMDALEDGFKSIIDEDFRPTGVIEVGAGMEDWPDKRPHDVQWVYIGIGGSAYAEGFTCVVAQDARGLRIRDVEWGRP